MSRQVLAAAAMSVALASFAWPGAAAEPETAAAAKLPRPESRFTLFPPPPPDLSPRQARWEVDVTGERLFHRPGDPDSLFSLGGEGLSGEARFAAAVEVNEALLRAMAPDPLVSASDPRGRLTGSFHPLDSRGRPYQFRLGARLVW